MTKRKIQYWVIPPEANAEFVASMEEVLETYAQPYNSTTEHPYYRPTRSMLSLASLVWPGGGGGRGRQAG